MKFFLTVSKLYTIIKKNNSEHFAHYELGGTTMRAKIITIIYTIEAFLDDIAYWVIGKGEDNKERTIKTFWGTHYMGD